jgi:hypothetical protein
MAIVVEGDQLVGVLDSEHHGGQNHQQPDPEHAREQGDKEPVTDIGDEFALAPPRDAGIAGPEMSQHRE